MRNIDELFQALARSRFRSSFKLRAREAEYLRQKTMPVILNHARDFIEDRLASAEPVNDGRQTPMKNHPVFIAQHATGTCCRKCLRKWHQIEQGRALTQVEIDYIIAVIEQWLLQQG